MKFPERWSKLNVALGHDWLTGMRGGERVLEIFCAGFPQAPIYTLLHVPRSVSAIINAHAIHTSWLQHIPGIVRTYRHFLPLFPAAIKAFRLAPADLLISTSHCVAKGLRPPPGTKHLCYCFTPMRYAWCFQREYFQGRPVARLFSRPVLAALRRWDRVSCKRVHHFVAISRHVQQRIRKFYNRDADVVYPPVDTHKWTPSANEHIDFDLVVSALVPYKRIDLAVRAYNRLGFPLKIVGTGTETQRLQSLAGPNIQFCGWQPDEVLLHLYRNCRLLVFPGEEDFGIVPLEAQACGKPVVAYAAGGALETVRDGLTGVLFHEQTEEALIAAVERCSKIIWDMELLTEHARQFNVQRFIDGLAAIIDKLLP